MSNTKNRKKIEEEPDLARRKRSRGNLKSIGGVESPQEEIVASSTDNETQSLERNELG
jgi:hypothetical protein